MPRRRSTAIVGGALIAATLVSPSAPLHAQQEGPEASPPIPGMSWGSPPVQREWEPANQGNAAQGAQGRVLDNTQDAQDSANAQVLMAQQVMAEQAKRMADFMFWQLILGGVLLIGMGATLYYARQIARAAVKVGPKAQGPVRADPTHGPGGGRINQQRKAQF
jgi:hypothetical protein